MEDCRLLNCSDSATFACTLTFGCPVGMVERALCLGDSYVCARVVSGTQRASETNLIQVHSRLDSRHLAAV